MRANLKPQTKINAVFTPISNKMHQVRMLQESIAIEERSAQIAADKEAKKKDKAEKLAADKKADDLRKLSLNESVNGAVIDGNAVEEGSDKARAIEILTVREAIDADEVEIILGGDISKKKRKYHSRQLAYNCTIFY